MRSDFEKHFLSLNFATENSAQICLDACAFDEKQDAYLPNIDWILENDEDECIAYCLVINAAYVSFKHQQSKVDGLQEEFAEDERFLKEKIDRKEQQIVELKYLQSMDKDFIHALKNKNDELQKRVDSVEQVISKIRNGNYASDRGERVANFIAGMLEQALEGSDK